MTAASFFVGVPRLPLQSSQVAAGWSRIPLLHPTYPDNKLVKAYLGINHIIVTLSFWARSNSTLRLFDVTLGVDIDRIDASGLKGGLVGCEGVRHSDNI